MTMPVTKTIYVSGKISGNVSYKYDFNCAVRELMERGWKKIITPTCLDGLDLDYEQYMTICYGMIDAADCVYMMRNWKDSEGAKREYMYAKAKQKEIFFEEDLIDGAEEV